MNRRGARSYIYVHTHAVYTFDGTPAMYPACQRSLLPSLPQSRSLSLFLILSLLCWREYDALMGYFSWKSALLTTEIYAYEFS
jgi:hypothetical protein